MILGKRFLQIRDNFTSILLEYDLPTSKHEYFYSKELLKRPIGIVTSQVKIQIEFNKEDWTKGILCDFELMLNRAMIQLVNCFQITSKRLCINHSWRFVTYYYLGFFSISAFLKLFRKGFVYIDRIMASELNIIYSAFASDPIIIKPGYYDECFISNGENYYLEISKFTNRTHDNTWDSFLQLINEIILYENDVDMELNFLHSFLQKGANGGYLIPSTLRNMFNYNLNYGYQDIFNKRMDFDRVFRKCADSRDFYYDNLIQCCSNIDDLDGQLEWVSNLSVALYFYLTEVYLDYNARKTSNNWFHKRVSYLKKNLPEVIKLYTLKL